MLALCLGLGLTEANAQSRNEFGSWIGVSAGSPTLIGKSERVSLDLFALRYSRIVLTRPAFDLRYTLDGVLFARLRYLNEKGTVETVHGRGTSPLGFEIGFRREKRVSPVVAASGGLLYFERNVPSMGRRLNLSGDLGAGLGVRITPTFGARIAYKYHHFSNAYTAPFNPGFDSNLFMIGVSVRP